MFGGLRVLGLREVLLEEGFQERVQDACAEKGIAFNLHISPSNQSKKVARRVEKNDRSLERDPNGPSDMSLMFSKPFSEETNGTNAFKCTIREKRLKSDTDSWNSGVWSAISSDSERSNRANPEADSYSKK